VRDLDSRLCRWRDSLPSELRLDIISGRASSTSQPDNTFLLQALALQVAYDNILILLHRPLLHSRAGPLQTPGRPQERAYPASPAHETLPLASTQNPSSMVDKYSRDRCLESASRSASLCDMKQYLMAAKSTHAVAHLSINLFTAGIVLSTVALSSPLSAVAQQAKNDIRKILIISEMFKSESPIAPQTKQILSALVKVILDKELEALACTESIPQPSSGRASPHRNLPGGQEDQSQVYPATHQTTTGVSEQDRNSRVADSFVEDHGTSGTFNDSDLPPNFDIDLMTGINALQDSE
jgi:hypothetical protein